MEETAFPAYFGEWLKRRRNKLDLTQAELGARAGCSVHALRKIESGERKPSRQLAGLLARSLKLPTEEHTTFVRVARGELDIERLRSPELLRDRVHPPDQLPASRRTNLPYPATPLVGRENELASLVKVLGEPDCRLLTITGMGGIGKTRLAIETALTLRASFPGGVYFVPLASLDSASFIVPAIAEALNISKSRTANPKEQLFSYMAAPAREGMLLVLDNLEHLLVPTAPEDVNVDAALLMAEMLKRIPNLKVLVTSRERINIQGEWAFELYGLTFPVVEQDSRLEEYSAPVLFLQRARQVRGDLEIEPDEQVALVHICQLVEGTPLASELAAGWAGVLSTIEIAQEIEVSLDFLTTTMRDAPERHQSLRAVFDHSWKLLSEDERDNLPRLSVFRGGFSREAAEAIAGVTLMQLEALVRRSLVQHTAEQRYDMHEMLRQYADGRLSCENQADAVCDRHLAYYLRLAQALDPSTQGMRNPNWAEQLEGELDNLRAALAWAIEHDVEEALRLCCALLMFWKRSWVREGHSWMKKALYSAESSSQPLSNALRARALFCLASLEPDPALAKRLVEESLELGEGVDDLRTEAGALALLAELELVARNDVEAGLLYQKSLALYEEIDDEYNHAWILLLYGSYLRYHGDYASSYRVCETALRIAEEVGQLDTVGLAMVQMGVLETRQANYTQAHRLIDQSFHLLSETGNRSFLVDALIASGRLASFQGEYHLAAERLDEARKIYQEIDTPRPYDYNLRAEVAYLEGDIQHAQQLYEMAMALEPRDPYDRGMTLLGLGAVRRVQGDSALAAQHTQQGLEYFQETQDDWMCGIALHSLGSIALAQSDLEEARGYFTDSLRRLYHLGDRRVIARCLEGLAAVRALEGNAAESARTFAEAHALRQSIEAPLPLVDRPGYERYIAATKAQLGEDAFDELWREGLAIDYETSMREILDTAG